MRSEPMTELSVVIPIKDERENLRPLHQRVRAALDPLGSTYEIVIVDDGSMDGSFAVLEEIAAADPCVKVVRLRRNFGQTAALQAGIDWSTGEVIATMDGDLQNDPADIPLLFDKMKEGYDAVMGERAKRQDHFLVRKVPSKIGNWLIRKVTGTTTKDLGCTLRLIRRDLAESLPLYGEMHRFIPVLLTQAGARMVQIPVTHHPRTAGQTKYGLSRTVRVVLDLMTVVFLHRYVTRPMHVFGVAGLVSMALGLVSLLATIAMKWWTHGEIWMTGNPFLHLSVMLELMGVQFLSIGLLGEMMTRTYFESQSKPPYMVRTTLNVETPLHRKAA
jgi:glycosyltransferase involved in cell wall biosynthesis